MKLTARMRGASNQLATASQGKLSFTWSTWFNRVRENWQQEWNSVSHTRFFAAITVAAAMLIAGSGFVIYHMNQTTSWERVFSNGQYVGLVPDNPDILDRMQRIANGFNVDLHTSPVHTTVSPQYNWQLTTTLPTSSTAILLNGKPIVYTSSPVSAQSVLKEVETALLPKGSNQALDAHFVGNVSLAPAIVSVADILDPTAAVRYILQPNSGTAAARSDSFGSLLDMQGPSLANAPFTSERSPMMQVAATEIATQTVSLPCKVRYVDDSQLGSGETKVVSKGKNGTAKETIRQEYVNGKLVKQCILAKDVLQQPVEEVVKRGTTNGVASGAWGWPTTMFDITSPFGARDLDGVHGFHPGVDIGCPIGTPIYATNNGVVEDAGWNDGGYGNWVKIDNGNGIETVFGHMSRVVAHSGETVSKGELIGYSGQTGFATGPHLHYEVRQNGTAINPAPYM